MIWVVLIIVGSYCVYLIALSISWKLIPINLMQEGKKQLVSIIIPVRNEDKSLEKLLEDLNKQDYPMELFEVLVIDDYSDDQTIQVAQNFKANYSMKVISLRELDAKPGKKSAITVGIEEAKGEVILATDGDCRVLSGWIESMQHYFVDKSVKMVLGPVKFNGDKNLFERLQRLEFAGLIGVGAGSLKMKVPNMCNGANLAYRKSIFKEVNGYKGNEQIPSGDDEFLMQKVFDLDPNSIAFTKDRSSVVSTQPKSSFSEFLNQRVRWAGKWRHHKTKRLAFWATIIFLFQISLVVSFLLPIWIGSTLLTYLLIVLGVKLVVEYLYLSILVKDLEIKIGLSEFLIIQLVYPFYIIYLSIISLFRKYSWKGREFS